MKHYSDEADYLRAAITRAENRGDYDTAHALMERARDLGVEV